MGMYDTVWVACPKCGHKNGFQAKTGPCMLNNYDLNAAPPEIMHGLDDQEETCEKCGQVYRLIVDIITRFSIDYEEEKNGKAQKKTT